MDRIIRLLALSLILLTLASPAEAAPSQTMVYNVYASGIHVLNAQLDFDLSVKGRYAIKLTSYTQGFLAKLIPWSGTFESQGWVVSPGVFRPELHRSTEAWRGKPPEIKSYHYDLKNGFQSLEITEKNKTKTPAAPPELTKGTTDAFTAALSVLAAVGAGKKCDGASDVYDGKRRFQEKFTDAGQEHLTTTPYNVFEGDADKCQVEVSPVAGEWSKKPRGWMSIQEQGRQAGALPLLWAGVMSKDVPAVPVKIQIKTAYGTLMMQLTEYKSGDKNLVAPVHQ